MSANRSAYLVTGGGRSCASRWHPSCSLLGAVCLGGDTGSGASVLHGCGPTGGVSQAGETHSLREDNDRPVSLWSTNIMCILVLTLAERPLTILFATQTVNAAALAERAAAAALAMGAAVGSGTWHLQHDPGRE